VSEEIISNIRQAVVANHGLQVHDILLLRVGTIPKTSSGKIQRYACSKGFLEKTLTLIYNDPHSL
jgi:acyl-CoA synthetase (AMP-forming)/AMP-acid ligase II